MGRKNNFFKLIFLISFLLAIQNIGSFSEGTWPPFDPNNPWPTQNTRHRISSHDGITDPYAVSSYSITGGFIDSPVVLSNDGNYYYFYFYNSSNNQKYLYRVSKSGSLDWSVEIGDVRGGAPVVIDAENYNGTKKDVILVQKFEGITAYFDDGSIYKTTADGSAYAKMSDNFMDVNTNGDILFSSLVTFYNENRIVTSRYFINRKNIASLDTSAESIVISEQMSESALNDAESESSVTTDQNGYTYSVIGGRLLVYNENFQEVLDYDHNALQSLYTSHVTVGPNNTLYIASYAQSNQYGFLSPMGSVLKVKLSSDRTQVLSAVKITDNGDPYSNTPYVHSQIAVDSSGNAYYTTGMYIYQNNIYQGMETGRLLKLDTDNNVTTLYTGNNEESFFQPPTLTNDGTIYLPNGVVLDSDGNQLWRKPCSYSVAVDNNGHAYFATGNNVTIYKQRAGGYPSLPGDLSVDESNPSADQITSESQVTITVNRLLNNEGSITVDYRTEGLSAVEGTDYLASDGTLTFSDQDTSESINLTYFNDRVNRGNRTFKLILENPTGCSDIPVNHPMEMIITINEDDSIDDTPPILISSTPTDGEIDVIASDEMTLVFNEYIISGEALNDITLSNGEDNVSITPTVGLKDVNISINSILKMATEYILTIPSNAIKDPSGNVLDQDLTVTFNTANAAFGGGNGSPENPYIIDSPKALYSIRDFPEKNYLMTQDIDMGASTSDGGDYYFEGKGWQPIPSFTGIFDGQNYSITNLNINRKDESLNMGLVSTNRGKILNLNVEDSHISYENTSTASSHIGLIAGYNTGLIYHCGNDGSRITFKQTSEMTNFHNGYNIGGIVGTNKGTISYSTNTATLVDESVYTSYICSIGGIAGFNDKQNATGIIKMCSNDASIDYPTTFAINNQVNSGGIVGRNQGSIFDSYNHKFIEKGYGIMGMDTSEWFATSIIERCYSISGQISLPRLSGKYVSIDNIYQYNGGTHVYKGLSDWGGNPVIGYTAIYDSLEKMKLEENYQGFDFEDTWRITADFPVLSPVIDIESLSVESNTVLLTKDETYDLNATITPIDATISEIYYLSNNSDVASVSSSGVITAVENGETEVYAYTLEGLHTQTIDVVVAEPTYSIAATPLNSFASKIFGYATRPEEQIVTISNSGNQEVTLSQPTSDVYEIGTLSETTLAPEEISTFTVQPKLDLAVGSYAENLSIEGTNGASTSIALDFTVSEVPTHIISAATINSFASKIVGYTEAPASQEVTITNIGNQEVTLTQPTAENYMVETLSTTTLAPGEQSTFTVQPKIALELGNYEENITIEGTEGASTNVVLDFNVISPPSNNDRSSSNDNNDTAEPADTIETITMTIDGEVQVVESVTRSEEGNQSVTVMTVDDELIQERLLSEENASVISLAISGDTDVGQVVLNGQTIKAMENKESTLEIKIDSAIYSLPAAEINVENLSEQFGEMVNLEDIKISVRIGEVSSETKARIQAVADENNYQVVVEPIDFEITCTYEEKAVKVSKFNVYVERMVPIPENIDPSKVTTGILFNNDGSFSHVPTTIVEVDNRYYAIIKSLTNSTYSVIYNPVEFSDVKGHWAKDSMEAMASRLIISCDEENQFNPDELVSRGEFTEIIIKALGLTASKGDIQFDDVTDVMPSKGHIKTAVNYTIVKGYGNGVFGPENKITREQAMVMIARGMNVAGFDSELTTVEMNAILQNYTDETKVSSYALKGVMTCLENDIILQSTENNIKPKGFVTRAEAAVLIQTMLLKLGLI